MVHAVYGDVKAKCPACRREPELRRQWGCDSPSESKVVEITCSACSGFDPACPICGGGGTEVLYRCPTSMCTSDLSEAFACYSAFDAHGVLPVEGGYLAQSREFLSFVGVVNAERAEIERARELERSREAPRRG